VELLPSWSGNGGSENALGLHLFAAAERAVFLMMSYSKKVRFRTCLHSCVITRLQVCPISQCSVVHVVFDRLHVPFPIAPNALHSLNQNVIFIN